MKVSSLSPFVSLCLCACLDSAVAAAPPAITYLYPSGAQRGTSIEVSAAGTLDSSTKVWASGKGVSVDTAKGKLKVVVAKDATPGVYWLRAHNSDGASAPRPFVVGTLPEVMEKEPNDEPRKPQVPPISSIVVNGKLEKNGDVDCYAVTLKRGQTLVASLEGHSTLRSPMDAMLQIVSPEGFVLEENNDFRGLDPQITYTATKDGTYIARVYAFPSTPDSSIRYFGSEACVYRLTLTNGPFADFAVPLAVSAEGKPAVEVRGWNLTPESHQLSFAPDADGFVTAYGQALANPLRLRLENHRVYTKVAGHLKPPFSATGQIDKPGTLSRFTIDVTKAKPVTLQAESRSLGLAVNPVIRVLDKDGKQLGRAEPGKLNTDTVLSFTPVSDGSVTVEVSDLFAGGGPRHAFLLRALMPEPDYDLTVAADRFAVVPGKPTTVPVKVNRRGGLSKVVDVVAEGLPEGVKIEVLPATKGKSDPTTVSVSLTAEKPTSGTFRLVGIVKDEPSLRRVARATLTEFDTTSPDLWLTVTTR